jgi:predicted MFS family arabinose efflux permease
VKKRNYSWIICVTCTLVQLSVSGMLTDSFTVFQPYILSVNGFTNTQLSLLIEIRTVTAFLTLFGVISFYEKLGFRRGLAAGTAVTAAAFLIFARAGSFAAYCAAFALAGVGYTLAGTVPCSLIIMKWFRDRSGLALGIMASGTGINNIVLSPLFTRLIMATSMQTGFMVQAVFNALVAVLLYFVIGTPEEKGCEPYTAPGFAAKTPKIGTWRMGKSQLLIMMAATLLLGGYVNVGFGYLTTMYSLEGFAPMLIAAGMSVIGASLIAGKCLFGIVSDRRGAMLSNALFYGASAAGLALCCFSGGGSVRMFASMLFLGLGMSMTSVSLPIWSEDLSGGDYPQVLKKLQMANMAGNLVFNMLPGPIADRFGSYVPVYMIFTVICVLSFAMVQYIYMKRKKALTKA